MKKQNNTFYSDFDIELIKNKEDRSAFPRTAFQQDRDRIIYTSAFRRLQSKTQVFFSGEYDFYRTRLTHSIEVAQIGRSVCHSLLCTSDLLSDEFYVDADLVEAICLAHDIGHPPFGHAGESTIHDLMKPWGGFEGNAQTLRILSETIYSVENGREGMNPTRALVDGVMKYKSTLSDRSNEGNYPKNHFIYDEQAGYRDFIFNRATFPAKINLNKFRSIECQIMDWADDTAYSVNDLLDGINSGLITVQKIERWAQEKNLQGEQEQLVKQLFKAIKARTVARFCSKKIGDCIRAASIGKTDNFMSHLTNRYAFTLKIDPETRQEADLYGQISRELVFWSPQIYQLEHKGDYILRQIWKAFTEHYLSGKSDGMILLPVQTEKFIRSEQDLKKRARLICDYLTGMTDGFAVRTYKRLYDADFGSIMDLV